MFYYLEVRNHRDFLSNALQATAVTQLLCHCSVLLRYELSAFKVNFHFPVLEKAVAMPGATSSLGTLSPLARALSPQTALPRAWDF